MRNTGLLLFGGFLIFIGLASLAGTLLRLDLWALLWPSLLIMFGVWLLLRPRLAGLGRGIDITFIGDVERSGAWKAASEEFWTFVGDINLDLTGAELPAGETVYRFFGFVADVDIYLPQGVGVIIVANGFVSSVKILGQKHDRFLLPFEWKSPNYDTAEHKIRFETIFFVNEMKIKQVNVSGIRGEYEEYGVMGYYEQQGGAYRNPHEAAVQAVLAESLRRWPLSLTGAQSPLLPVLDLACGSGEITLALREMGCTRVDGIDPYTGAAYLERTGQAAEPVLFEQIASGALAGRWYSLIVCSYALHLVAESRLPVLAYQLSRVAPNLLVITPHKRPHLRAEWGWTQVGEITIERVRGRLYHA